MKYYAQITELNNMRWNPETSKIEKVEPYQVDCLGSEGVIILDGRLSLESMKEVTRAYIKRLKSIHPNMSGFQIYKASNFYDTTFLYDGE